MVIRISACQDASERGKLTDDKTAEQTRCLLALEMTVYEQLYSKLYAYRFGTIGFLELLDAFEEILHIQPPQPNRHSDVA